MVKLVFLGKFRGLGREDAELALPAEVRTLGELKDWIGRRDPDFGKAMTAVPAQCAVNHTLVRDMSLPIRDRDEIAFLPPMSGG